jgi:CubicO group peptidase (beta-lactamase class C family)
VSTSTLSFVFHNDQHRIKKGAIDWAGALVEKLSGMSLGDYLQKYICDPCGVTGIKYVSFYVSLLLIIFRDTDF